MVHCETSQPSLVGFAMKLYGVASSLERACVCYISLVQKFFFCSWKLDELPSRELTYPPDKAYLKMIFLFPR